MLLKGGLKSDKALELVSSSGRTPDKVRRALLQLDEGVRQIELAVGQGMEAEWLQALVEVQAKLEALGKRVGKKQ
jgi:hypothetical protein